MIDVKTFCMIHPQNSSLLYNLSICNLETSVLSHWIVIETRKQYTIRISYIGQQGN